MENKNRFKLAREMAGNPSLDDVAKKSGVSKNTIWKLERGLVDAGYKIVRLLAEYYQVNVAWLIGMPNTSPVLDESSQAVTLATGLSEKAIENLQKMKHNTYQTACINGILESDDFIETIERISTAMKIHKNPFFNPVSERITQAVRQGYNSGNNPLVMDHLTKSETVDYYLWSASDKLGRIIRNVVEREEK